MCVPNWQSEPHHQKQQQAKLCLRTHHLVLQWQPHAYTLEWDRRRKHHFILEILKLISAPKVSVINVIHKSYNNNNYTNTIPSNNKLCIASDSMLLRCVQLVSSNIFSLHHNNLKNNLMVKIYVDCDVDISIVFVSVLFVCLFAFMLRTVR